MYRQHYREQKLSDCAAKQGLCVPKKAKQPAAPIRIIQLHCAAFSPCLCLRASALWQGSAMFIDNAEKNFAIFFPFFFTHTVNFQHLAAIARQ